MFLLKRQKRKDRDEDPDSEKHDISYFLQRNFITITRSAHDDEREGCGNGEVEEDLDGPFHIKGFCGGGFNI